MRRAVFWAMCGVCWTAGLLPAETLFVNNLNGRDQNDGLAAEPLSGLTGPVRSIRRALQLATSGSTIVVTNTGTPYYESLSLIGGRLSGVPRVPLTILGNGATLSGLRGLPPTAWQQETEDLWRVTFNRKGFYQLLRDGFVVTEHRPDDGGDPRATLPAGQWCAYRGDVYYRQDGITEPPLERFDYAADEMGITLYQVEHVRIVDLTVEHFRVDGINAYNMCREIVLENVIIRENGRAGLALSGTSGVLFRGGRIEANGRESALIRGRARLHVIDAEYDVEPKVLP